MPEHDHDQGWWMTMTCDGTVMVPIIGSFDALSVEKCVVSIAFLGRRVLVAPPQCHPASEDTTSHILCVVPLVRRVMLPPLTACFRFHIASVMADGNQMASDGVHCSHYTYYCTLRLPHGSSALQSYFKLQQCQCC